jgi:predicted nucleotidyltransferase
LPVDFSGKRNPGSRRAAWHDAGMPPAQFPPDVAELLERLRDRLAARPDVVGVYLYGSLATGDYSPAVSDIDVVVLVGAEPGQAAVRELTRLHTALAATGGPAGQLHCLYVAADAVTDAERLCPYWFGDRMTQWQMKLLTQAELASAGGHCTARGRRRARHRSRRPISGRPCTTRLPATGAGQHAAAGRGCTTPGSTTAWSSCPAPRPC